jgi:hypothetical protein
MAARLDAAVCNENGSETKDNEVSVLNILLWLYHFGLE